MIKNNQKTINVEGIDILVTKKKIKNINLSISGPNGLVKLSAPLRTTDKYIKEFVSSKLDWIRKNQIKYENSTFLAEYSYLSGEFHYFAGNKYTLKVYSIVGRQHAVVDGEFIKLFVKEDSTTESRKKIINEFYRKYLNEAIPVFIDKWEPRMNVTVNEFRTKLMKTRWGTCNTRDKRIWINLELGKKDASLLEYIVVHEMVHLLEKSHNHVFKNYMTTFLPEWKDLQKNLNIN